MKRVKYFIKFLILIKSLNVTYTIYFNLRFLPFKQAIRLPFFVYGKIKLFTYNGKILLKSHSVYTGMVHIGKDLDHNPVSVLPVKLVIYDELIFRGPALISGGSTITVWRGKIVIGQNVLIGSGCQIKAVELINIGDNTIVSSLCTIMDTNVHYIKNSISNKIHKNSSPINIGKYCWVNSNSVISKGSYLNDYCIVGRNSIFNLSLVDSSSRYNFYAGTPAKLIRTNVCPVFDFCFERKLNKYFREHDVDYYISDQESVNTMQGVLDLF